MDAGSIRCTSTAITCACWRAMAPPLRPVPAPRGTTHTAAQWTELNTSGDVVQGGRIEDPTATSTNGGKWYAYPSVAANGNGDVLIGFGQFTSADYGSSAYAYHHHTDAAGTTRDPVVYKAGQDCYSNDLFTGKNRWGDYSHTMVDPTGAFGTSPSVASNAFWTIQEFAKPQAPPTVGGSTSKWGTYWAKINPFSFAPFTDDPLVQGSTPVKVVHITELRTRIDAARGAHGLGAFPFTDPTLTQGSTPVKAVHIAELRTALDQVYAAAALSHGPYTDSTLTAGVTVVKAVHFSELRTFLTAVE
jgi:hypothetical protein